MRLRLFKPTFYTTGPVILRTLSGAVRFWNLPTKGAGQELVPGGGGTIEFGNWDYVNAKDVWVEATDKSGALRDIVIELEYGGESDIVKATAVWAELEAVEHDLKSHAQLFAAGTEWSDAPQGFKDSIEPYGGSGVRPFDPDTVTNAELDEVVGIANVIMFKWQVTPAGIGDQVGPNGGRAAYFDVTRRVEAHAWQWTLAEGRTPAESFERDLPDKNEQPNDDALENDEFDNPPLNDRLYNSDKPGLRNATTLEDRLVIRANFSEFVRIGFKSTEQPVGNVVAGSRASDPYRWHSRIDVKPSTSAPYHLERNPNDTDANGDPLETSSNDIGPPHLTEAELTTPPT